jgi:hypothetical protein
MEQASSVCKILLLPEGGDRIGSKLLTGCLSTSFSSKSTGTSGTTRWKKVRLPRVRERERKAMK